MVTAFDKIRAAFEEWLKTTNPIYLDLDRRADDSYDQPSTNARWEAWNACARYMGSNIIRGVRSPQLLKPIQKETDGWLPTSAMPMKKRVRIKTPTGLDRIAVGYYRTLDGRVRCSSRDKKVCSDLIAIAWKPLEDN